MSDEEKRAPCVYLLMKKFDPPNPLGLRQAIPGGLYRETPRSRLELV